MKKIFVLISALWTLQATAANLPLTIQAAKSSAAPEEVTNPSAAPAAERLILATQEGRTLYTFTPDAPGVSNCEGGCAKAWPPVLVSPTEKHLLTGVLGTTTRKDGSLQLTISGQPVYLFAGDQAVGDILGQGLNDVWFVLDLNLVRK